MFAGNFNKLNGGPTDVLVASTNLRRRHIFEGGFKYVKVASIARRWLHIVGGANAQRISCDPAHDRTRRGGPR